VRKSRSERLTDRSHQSGSAGVLARESRMRVGHTGEGLGEWADRGDLAQAALSHFSFLFPFLFYFSFLYSQLQFEFKILNSNLVPNLSSNYIVKLRSTNFGDI
jgi:hypothetical protein